MIVLDTNALSDGMKPSPSERVLRWLASKEPSGVFVTTISQAEILAGIEVMPAGKRKQSLSAAAQKMFDEVFHGRILSFDPEAARQFAAISAIRKAAGRPISQFDAMIAAVVRVHRADLATRNVRDFDGCGIRLVNPWTDVH
ncbi:MAG: type II toxin-antitoxin system VapC family toxin [Bryobacteraceae bacterium]|jgi:predicted nucleic acid-binding protein